VLVTAVLTLYVTVMLSVAVRTALSTGADTS
jgi:hypothetical protein